MRISSQFNLIKNGIPSDIFKQTKLTQDYNTAPIIPTNGLLSAFDFTNYEGGDTVIDSVNNNTFALTSVYSIVDHPKLGQAIDLYPGDGYGYIVPQYSNIIETDVMSISMHVNIKSSPDSNNYFFDFYTSYRTMLCHRNSYFNYTNDLTPYLPLNEWIHLVFTFEYEKVRIWINKELKINDDDYSYAITPFGFDTSSCKIGNAGGSTTDGYASKLILGNFKMYDRELTQDEINSLYDEGL